MKHPQSVGVCSVFVACVLACSGDTARPGGGAGPQNMPGMDAGGDLAAGGTSGQRGGGTTATGDCTGTTQERCDCGGGPDSGVRSCLAGIWGECHCDVLATPEVDPIAIDDCGSDNPGGLSPGLVQTLKAGGSVPADMRWLYPYEGTILPGGLRPVELMWNGPLADVVYVHIHASKFDYEGCLALTEQGRLLIPQEVWDGANQVTQGESDPFTIELTLNSFDNAVGPISLKFSIAQGTLKGSIYYTSYGSQIAGEAGVFGAGILRLPVGKPGDSEVFLGQSGCTSCHSVSSRGTHLLAAISIDGLSGLQGASYELTPDLQANPSPLQAPALGAPWAGMYADGSIYVGTALQSGVGPITQAPPIPNPDVESALYVTATGDVVSDTGIPPTAMVPSFSADGSLLVFTDYALGDGHGLAMMDFEGTARKATNYRTLFEDGEYYPAWPFILGDNEALVFARGVAANFGGMGAGIGGLPGMHSDLYFLDLDSGEVRLLARAMGFDSEADAASNTTYLPFGVPDLHQNYYPTLFPVASGGYFWVFFDSARNYGNRGVGRGIWGTAISVSADGSYAEDPSHPPFLLPGQEIGVGNHRAFAALDPCQADGEQCTSGFECCGGACTDGACGEPLQCSHIDEVCESADDCCDTRLSCLGGFCGVRGPD